MKLISLIVLFCLSLNVFASSGTIQALESHVDNYQYALTVEWDQKDQAFYSKTTEEFFNQLSTLIETQGLSREDLQHFVEKKYAQKTDVEAIKLQLSLMGNTVSPGQLTEFLKSNAHLFYDRGASWNGEVILYIGGGLVVAALIGYVIWHAVNYKCIEWDYRRKYGCNSSNCYEKFCAQYEER